MPFSGDRADRGGGGEDAVWIAVTTSVYHGRYPYDRGLGRLGSA